MHENPDLHNRRNAIFLHCMALARFLDLISLFSSFDWFFFFFLLFFFFVWNFNDGNMFFILTKKTCLVTEQAYIELSVIFLDFYINPKLIHYFYFEWIDIQSVFQHLRLSIHLISKLWFFFSIFISRIEQIVIFLEARNINVANVCACVDMQFAHKRENT